VNQSYLLVTGKLYFHTVAILILTGSSVLTWANVYLIEINSKCHAKKLSPLVKNY